MTRKIELIVIALAFLSMGFTWGAIFQGWRTPISTVEVTKVVRVEVEKPIIVEKIVERSVPVEVPYYTNTIIVVSPDATNEELLRAFNDIEKGLFSHKFYVGHPEFQTPQTGNTTLNLYWIDSYNLLKELLERAYGRDRFYQGGK